MDRQIDSDGECVAEDVYTSDPFISRDLAISIDIKHSAASLHQSRSVSVHITRQVHASRIFGVTQQGWLVSPSARWLAQHEFREDSTRRHPRAP